MSDNWKIPFILTTQIYTKILSKGEKQIKYTCNGYLCVNKQLQKSDKSNHNKPIYTDKKVNILNWSY